jgi:hypothetical protein
VGKRAIAARRARFPQEPRVIELLRNVLALLAPLSRRRIRREEERLLSEIAEITQAWEQREDLDELAALLGLRLPRGRRITRRSVNRKIGLAVAVHLHPEKTHDELAELYEIDDPSTITKAIAAFDDIGRELADSMTRDTTIMFEPDSQEAAESNEQADLFVRYLIGASKGKK